MKTVDLVIVGAGFGGSLLAMVARRLGRSVALIERGQHPRFAIGESTSPLTNLLLEEIAHRYDLPRLLPLASFGAWQRAYPHLGVGLKRGFTYFGHTAGQPFSRCADRSDQLAVAASPGDDCADTHWLRADVDAFLAEEAASLGADYRDRTTIHALERAGDGLWRLVGVRDGASTTVQARFLVDASGPRGFLYRALGLREAAFPGYPPTQALFSHFTGVRRVEAMAEFAPTGGAHPPYPLDDAALHHVFDGGWMWVLHFGNGVTSAGFSVQQWLGDELGLTIDAPELVWRRFLTRFPGIGAQFRDAVPVQPWHVSPQLSFRTERAVGDGWAMLPSAAGFIDPLFSTGFPLTLLGVQRLGRWLESGAPSDAGALAEYAATTFEELDWTADFVGAHHRAMGRFPHFAALSMVYFAAASYAELLRRLGRHDDAFRYLSANDPVFRAGIARCEREPDLCPREFARKIADDIAHKNVAGLADPAKGNWYGVDLSDVVRGAEKLGFTPDRMREIIATADWARC